MPKTPKPKKPFLDRYKTYDPDVEGFGNPSQWRDAFRARLGLDKAKEILQDQDPWSVLGVSKNATWQEVHKAYKTMARKSHPDWIKNHPNETLTVDDFKRIQAAYEVLEARYNKG